MRFTAEQYTQAIDNLNLARLQLVPDGNPCAVCGDSGHMAFECGFNPLLAVYLCSHIANQSEQFHETLHWLAGHAHAFGEQLGPKKIIMPNAGEAAADKGT